MRLHLSQRDHGGPIGRGEIVTGHFSQYTRIFKKEEPVADVRIEDGIIRVLELDVQDPKAAAVLAEYPQVRWAEITRRALKIGLGYLKGGARD